MRRKLRVDMDNIINKVPYFIILMLMIVLAPLGVWLFVIRIKNRKRKIYNKSRTLTWLGCFILFIIGIGIYSKVKEIIVLYDSGMSLDMINFIPDNLWLYIIGIVMCISYLKGAKKLMEQAKIERNYIKLINLNKETSLKKMSKELSANIESVKENIKILDNLGYLVPLEIDDKKNKIVYKNSKEQKVLTNVSNRTIKTNKTVQCSKCGAIVSLRLEEYVECEFCGHGLIEENNC